jgi:hypothetical protein
MVLQFDIHLLALFIALVTHPSPCSIANGLSVTNKKNAENDGLDDINVRKIDLGSIKAGDIIFPGEELYEQLEHGLEGKVRDESSSKTIETFPGVFLDFYATFP